MLALRLFQSGEYGFVYVDIGNGAICGGSAVTEERRAGERGAEQLGNGVGACLLVLRTEAALLLRRGELGNSGAVTEERRAGEQWSRVAW